MVKNIRENYLQYLLVLGIGMGSGYGGAKYSRDDPFRGSDGKLLKSEMLRAIHNNYEKVSLKINQLRNEILVMHNSLQKRVKDNELSISKLPPSSLISKVDVIANRVSYIENSLRLLHLKKDKDK